MHRFIALVDIDHTVSNSFWRDAMIGGEWDDYHRAAIYDRPLPDTVAMIRALHDAGWSIYGLTARPSKWRKMTLDWLLAHDVKIDEMLMREDEDYRPAPAMKIALAKQKFGELRGVVTVVFDDRDDVIAAFRAEGVTAVQVNGVK
jgi:phosphoglycolate phosphatase-like HAD superfamily hydrolase